MSKSICGYRIIFCTVCSQRVGSWNCCGCCIYLMRAGNVFVLFLSLAAPFQTFVGGLTRDLQTQSSFIGRETIFGCEKDKAAAAAQTHMLNIYLRSAHLFIYPPCAIRNIALFILYRAFSSAPDSSIFVPRLI